MKYNEIHSQEHYRFPLVWTSSTRIYCTTNENITSGLLDGVTVDVKMIGHSWQGNIADRKYKKHAALLEDYIDNKDRNPRWVFYTAQSYHDPASLP